MYLQGGLVLPWCVRLCCSLQPYPLKLPPCLQAMSFHPGNTVRHYFRVGAILRRHLLLPLASSPLLSRLPRPARPFFWLLFTASSGGPSPENPRSALSPGYDRTGASPLLRCKGSTAVSQCSLPRCVPLHRIFSSSCYGLAPGSTPLCGQSQGIGNTSSNCLFKRGVQPPSVLFRTFQLNQQVLGSRLPYSLDCGAQFIRVDALLEFAQDGNVTHSLCRFYEHRF